MAPIQTAARAGRRVALRRLLPVLLVLMGLLVTSAVSPPAAHAVDLFPIDDWLGDGIESIGKVVLGPLKIGAEGIAKLLAAIVGALADLLIPKSLIQEGLGAIRWLVQLPALGVPAGQATAPVRMPHLQELRDTLTWIGLTLVPLQIVVAGGRSFLSPSVDGDSPAEVLQRAIAASIGLLAFDWLWGSLTHLTGLVTSSLLRLPWVADGVERMFEALVIGGASGTAVAAAFVIPLLLAAAGAVLLALMLLRIGLEVIGSLVYALGGLALGLSVSQAGHRLLQAWLVAATAVFVLPVLWCVVFVTGAALMLDAGGDTEGGFGEFVRQLFNIGAALVTFMLAIKLARATLGHAGTAIAGLGATARLAGSPGSHRPGPGAVHPASPSTPASLAQFSRGLRGGMRGAATGTARAGTYPVRHPALAAQAMGSAARHPVQATQQAAQRARDAMSAGGAGGAAAVRRVQSRAQHAFEPDRKSESRPQPASHRGTGGEPQRDPRTSTGSSQRPGASGAPPGSAPVRPARPRSAARPRDGGPGPSIPPDAPPSPAQTTGAGSIARPVAPQSTGSAASAAAWRTTRRVVAPQRRSKQAPETRRGRGDG